MRSTPAGILTPSDSEPGLWYDVTPEHCPCKSFQFGHARDPQFKCKHQRRHFPAPAPTFTCIECGLWPARQDDVICRHCRDAQDAAAMAALPVDEADVPVEATPIYRETLLSVCYAAPEGGSTDALHGAIAEGRARHEATKAATYDPMTERVNQDYAKACVEASKRERHAKALAAPAGTFTLLASNPYEDLFD